LVLTVCIVLGALAYMALGGSPTMPTAMSPVKADALPTALFHAKALVGTGTRQRERDVEMTLADGRVTVSTGATSVQPLYSVPYRNVRSVHYSRGRDPMWKSPEGPARLVRADGGRLARFGIFVDRHWISLETDTEDKFIVLRVEEGVVRSILAALEEHTGRTPATVGH
jgi:hypothetical protein